ncbi:MAG: 50S ribosomal protein L25 [Anaerolineales bacterium]|nr:50S ribosomal protein L25 [Anaerolineales bacterium]
MDKTVVQAEKRAVVGKQVRALRRDGKLPAVIYGYGINPISIVLDAHSASRILAKASSSTLVTIELEGKQYPTLVREKQLDFIRNSLIHIDFMAVSMTEKLTASVGVHLEGTAPAVKDFNAVLVTGLTELEVECLATDLPERFVVDISGLAEIGDGVYVKDVVAPANVEILDDPEEMIVVATAMAAEEVEEEKVLEGEEGEEPEVIDKGKKEGEEEEGE